MKIGLWGVRAALRDIEGSKPQQQPTMLRRHCPR